MADVIKRARLYIRRAFQAHPHFSFNNWKIMYDHSILVEKFSWEIADVLAKPYDKDVLSLAALLHDIGKTYQADEETLRKRHAELAWEVARDFLESLGLTKAQKAKLQDILMEKGEHIEGVILEDADIIAFYADPALHTAFKKWALERGLAGELDRKLEKVKQLHFTISKALVASHYQKIRTAWGIMKKILILASQSKGRSDLLKEAGFTFTIVPSDVDESAIQEGSPYRLVEELALAKARAVAAKVKKGAAVVAGDVVGRIDGKIVGKAKDEEEARWMLTHLSKEPVECIAGYAVIDTETCREWHGYDVAWVHFKKASDEDIQTCIEKGIPFRCAAGFAMREEPCRNWVERVEGDESVVIGLPMRQVKEVLAALAQK